MAGEIWRDRKFCHEVFPQGEVLARLADVIVAELLAYEEREGLRKRRRKHDAEAAMRSAVHTIVANLAHMVLFPPSASGVGLILPLGHRRGPQAGPSHDGFGEALPALLESLQALGVLTLAKPEQYRQATTVAPTIGFHFKLAEAGVEVTDIGRKINPERLVLLSRRRGEGRTFFPVPATPETWRHQANMARINTRLAGADVAYVGNEPVDVGNRLLVRRFNLPEGIEEPCLDFGGRLCGGFWQNMPKHQRRHIRIDGEEAVELDYGQVFPRLAYGLAGAVPPQGTDLYAIPGLEGNRDGVKRGFNALLWGTKRWNPEIADALPREWTAKALRRALAAAHPAIAGLLQSGPLTGYRLLHRESSVMLTVLLACMAAGIIALPIHDAVLVPASTAHAVAEIMEQSALAVAGVSVPVSFKP